MFQQKKLWILILVLFESLAWGAAKEAEKDPQAKLKQEFLQAAHERDLKKLKVCIKSASDRGILPELAATVGDVKQVGLGGSTPGNALHQLFVGDAGAAMREVNEKYGFAPVTPKRDPLEEHESMHACLQELLRIGCLVNQVNQIGKTPLHYACNLPSDFSSDLILKEMSKVKDRRLTTEASSRVADIVLLRANMILLLTQHFHADATLLDFDGDCAFDRLKESTILAIPEIRGLIRSNQIFIKNTQKKAKASKALHDAVLPGGSLTEVQTALANGADPNYTKGGDSAKSVLNIAIQVAGEDVITTLLDAGAKIPDSTAVLICTKPQTKAMIEKFLEHGLNPNQLVPNESQLGPEFANQHSRLWQAAFMLGNQSVVEAMVEHSKEKGQPLAMDFLGFPSFLDFVEIHQKHAHRGVRDHVRHPFHHRTPLEGLSKKFVEVGHKTKIELKKLQDLQRQSEEGFLKETLEKATKLLQNSMEFCLGGNEVHQAMLVKIRESLPPPYVE